MKIHPINIEFVVWGLQQLSDKELQEKLWMGLMPGQMSTFEEAVCVTFDDSHLGRLLDFGQSSDQISPESLEKLAELSHAVDALQFVGSPSELIQHPIMEEVRILARESLALMRRDGSAKDR